MNKELTEQVEGGNKLKINANYFAHTHTVKSKRTSSIFQHCIMCRSASEHVQIKIFNYLQIDVYLLVNDLDI